MSNPKILAIPNSGGILPMRKKDQLTIKVSQTCQWCYKDPSNCFPNFLKPGQVDPGEYGPYTAENDGTVHYGCPKNPPCVPQMSPQTPHTITVTG